MTGHVKQDQSAVERRLDRLDEIVAVLEGDQLDLAAALALFEEGVTCLREASAVIAEAEERVQRLTELADGALVLEELDDE